MVKQESQQSRKLQDSVRVRVEAPDKCPKFWSVHGAGRNTECYRDKGHKDSCFYIYRSAFEDLAYIGYYFDSENQLGPRIGREYFPEDARLRIHLYEVKK